MPRQPSKNVELLRYEHKQVLDLGKYYYSLIFSLASLTFAFNGALMTALYFVVFNKPEDTFAPDLLSKFSIFWLSIFVIGVFGLVYNLGATCSFYSTNQVASRLSERFARVDRLLGLQIAECHNEVSARVGQRTHQLTLAFFGLWILVWGFVLSIAVLQYAGMA